MMTALAFALAYSGFTGLCLGMHRHYQQVWGSKLEGTIQARLRIAGWLCLALSLPPSLMVWGGAIGAVAWFGILSLAGLMLGFLLPYVPRVAAGLALMLPFTTTLALLASGV